MKLFQITWTSQGETDLIAAESIIGAIKFYCTETSFDINDFEDDDEIVEIPKEKWAGITIKNTEYDESDPEDKEIFTAEEIMAEATHPEIVGGTAYL